MNQFKLTISEGQLVTIQTALEWFFRLQMGQFFDYTTEIAKCGYEYDKDNPDNDRLFDEYIKRRNDSQDIFQIAYNIAHPKICNKTEDMNIAIDMWQAIRYFRWCERPEPKAHDTVDSRKPLHWSSEPVIQIEREEYDTE